MTNEQSVTAFLTENFTVFFSNAGKTENVPEFEFKYFRRPSFGDDMLAAFIV